MDEYVTNSTNHLIESITNTSLIKFAGICQHAGCKKRAFIYQDPDQPLDNSPQTIICCNFHAQSAGFCYGCGRFCGEIKGFDVGDGMSEDCESEFWQRYQYDEYDDDEYDDEYYD